MSSGPKWHTFYGNKITRGKTKKTGKPKSYNLYSNLRSALRQVWLRSPAKQEAERMARISRGLYLCATCKGEFTNKQVRMDHILPVVCPEKGFSGWDSYMERMFCGPEGLQCLCELCHSEKTAQERAIRKRGEQSELI